MLKYLSRSLGQIISFHHLCVAPDSLFNESLRFGLRLQTVSPLNSSLIIHDIYDDFIMDSIANDFALNTSLASLLYLKYFLGQSYQSVLRTQHEAAEESGESKWIVDLAPNQSTTLSRTRIYRVLPTANSLIYYKFKKLKTWSQISLIFVFTQFTTNNG